MRIVADHRNVYHFAIFIFGLHIALSLVQIIVESLSGYRFYLFSEYFEPWLILTTTISIAVYLLLTWYFRVKNYKLTLIALVATFLASLAYNPLACMALADKELRNFVPIIKALKENGHGRGVPEIARETGINKRTF